MSQRSRSQPGKSSQKLVRMGSYNADTEKRTSVKRNSVTQDGKRMSVEAVPVSFPDYSDDGRSQRASRQAAGE